APAGRRHSPPSLTHRLDEALRAHVRPVLLDVVQARLPGVLALGYRPAGGDLGEGRPQRVLALVVDQDEVGALGVLERVGHVGPSQSVLCSLSSFAARTAPISAAGPGSSSRWWSTSRA